MKMKYWNVTLAYPIVISTMANNSRGCEIKGKGQLRRAYHDGITLVKNG